MSEDKVIRRKKGENKKSEKAAETISTDNNEKKDSNQKFRYGPMPTFSYQRLWSRGVIIIGMIVFVWYTSYNSNNEKVLAKYNTDIKKVGQQFECDEKYLNEIENYPKCIPKKCGRWVTDRLITHNEADMLLSVAKRGFALGGSSGGATILDLHSGALSFGKKFIDIYSLDKPFLTNQDLAIYTLVKSKIQHAIAENFHVDENSLYLTHPTFFSKLTAAQPKTPHDEYWKIHVDKETYESFHYTSLIYLNDYNIDFKGGRFIFVQSPQPNRNITIEPRKGRVSMFTSGAENPHYVERVKNGVRYAITVSFTCDKTKGIDIPQVRN